MGVTDWNWRLAADPQDYPWDCAATSLAWSLRTIGLDYSEQDVIDGLGPSRISPTYGLLDASGSGLVSYLAEIGVSADNDADASWSEVQAAAGYQPMVIGGRGWNHWVAVRMGSLTATGTDDGPLVLMNPAAGWMGIGQYMFSDDFENLGSFSAVWFTGW